MKMKTLLMLALASILTACDTSQTEPESNTPTPSAEPTNKVVLASQVEWGALNPARGDKGPRAANLWGDRTTTGPAGFLVKFLDGFSSPPHIHNITYRGLVISGTLHNDDPNAANMWLPAGSYWTQPAGEVHITAAEGSDNMAYIEIENGPYLVQPTEEAFDNGERPVNVHESNLVWLDASNIIWIDPPAMPAAANGPKVAFLWGSPQPDQLNGSLLKIPAAYAGEIKSDGSIFHAVVIQGQAQYKMPGETNATTLEPGSSFSSEGASVHQVSSEEGEETLIYIRTNGKIDLIKK